MTPGEIKNRKPPRFLRGLWLRDRHRDTNSLILEIPVTFMNSDRSAKHIVIDRDRLPYYLHLRRTDVDALVAAGLIAEETEKGYRSDVSTMGNWPGNISV